MEEDTRISDHLSILNGFISDLEAIGVVISDEDKALRLIWSIPFLWIDTVIYSEVTTKLMSKIEGLAVRKMLQQLKMQWWSRKGRRRTSEK